jgi:hypothetical protein
MATKVSSKVAAGTPAKLLPSGLVAVSAVYSVNASLSAGDVIQMVNVPKGAMVVYAALNGIGTNQEAIVALGDGLDNDRYMDHATMSASTAPSRILNYASLATPYVYSTDDTIDIAISTVSLDTIGGGFHLTVFFSKDTA